MESRTSRIGIVVTAIACLVWEVGATAVVACPMCKAALDEDPAKPMAFQTSILFMLTMIMAVFGSIMLLLAIVNRREMQSLDNSEFASA